MQFQSQAHNSGVFTEGNNSNLTGRYGWVERLVHWSNGIPASIEDLQNDMSATMMRRQSPIDYMSTWEHEGSIIWKITAFFPSLIVACSHTSERLKDQKDPTLNMNDLSCL